MAARVMLSSVTKDDLFLGLMLISLNVGLVLWVAYGFLIHSPPIILPNAVTFCLSAALLAMKLCYHKTAESEDKQVSES
jgi:MtN3 and saliva related transmembrane protein